MATHSGRRPSSSIATRSESLVTPASWGWMPAVGKSSVSAEHSSKAARDVAGSVPTTIIRPTPAARARARTAARSASKLFQYRCA
jgi:hypothetical protein